MVVRAVIAASSFLIGFGGTFAACQAQTGNPPVYQNGPPNTPGFFPIAVWWQQANGVGHSGPYPTIAAAAAAAKINIMLGQGANWPESFGADQGEFEAIKQNGLYLIGGVSVPSNQNTSNTSVASILALAQSIGAQANLIGYNAGDEPQCSPGAGQIAMNAVPNVIAGIHSFDSTRLVTLNETAWMLQPQWQNNPIGCLSWDEAALQATSVASFDYYPLTSPYIATELGVTGTDYQSVSNDSLYVQGVAVQAIRRFAAAGEPIWAYIESGSDNFGLSEANSSINAGVTAGSTTLVVNSKSRFTSTWIGLQVSGSGIPSGTRIVSVTDPLHAVMSQAATTNSSGESVAVSGGTMGDCVASANLCVVNGNEYRPTPEQVAAEVWMSIINGATGIEYFCHDSMSYSFCLDDTAAGGTAAETTFQNITHIDRQVLLHAPELNATTVGQCSMDQLNYTTGNVTTSQSCSGGELTLTTSNPAVPGAALVKSYKGSLYIFAQAARRSQGGATFSFAIPAMAGRQATVVWDSNNRYNRVYTSIGSKFALSGSGGFSDTFGQNTDYEVKIYRLR